MKSRKLLIKDILRVHRGGKLQIEANYPIRTRQDLSMAYTPGVGQVVELLAKNPSEAKKYTIAGQTVAVITNGTAVLGYGDVGPVAAMPVMEGKCVIFKELAGINAFPLCLNEKDPQKFIETVVRLAPNFAAINLEDIAAPDCFIIEKELQKRLSIPVMHDDQHGTAIVVAAALLGALHVYPKKELRVVIAGAGAAGTAIAKLLWHMKRELRLADLKVVDSRGIVSTERRDLSPAKRELATLTKQEQTGSLALAVTGSDVLIGVSVAGLFTSSMIKTMRSQPFVFALANPTPEIMPEAAYAAGAALVGTGRSDLPNQINNALAYPGVFKGLLIGNHSRVTTAMKAAAAKAIFTYHRPHLDQNYVLPDILDRKVVGKVASSLAQ